MSAHNDSDMIFEKYQAVNEGMFDRLQAKGAGLVGSAKGLGQQIKGKVKGTVAGAKGDLRGVYKAKQDVKAGSKVGPVAKVESYKKIALKKIDELSQEIINDLSKLGIDSGKLSAKNNSFKKNLEKSLNDLIAEIKK